MTNITDTSRPSSHSDRLLRSPRRRFVPRLALAAVAALGAVLLLPPVPAAAATAAFSIQAAPLVDPFPELVETLDSPNPRGSGRRLRLSSPLGPARPAFPRRVGADLVAVARAPFDWEGRDWKRLGLAALAVGAAALVDEEIDGWLDANRSPGAVQAARAIRPLGQEGALLLLGATWLAGRRFDRPELAAVAEDGFEAAIIAAGVITPALKAITARARPRFNSDAEAFGAGGQSFPSGETTMAFALASVIAAHSEPRWVDVLAWSTAGLIGLQRMTLDAHWASDVVAGALIGAAVGHWVVRRNHPERGADASWSFAPSIGPHGGGITVGVRF